MFLWKKLTNKIDKRAKNQISESKQENNSTNVVIMQSECLGMTVIQEGDSSNQQITEISPSEWIQILQTKDLSSCAYQRIYYSFLKGIPTFMRMKIWLLLCTENSGKQFKYSSKVDVDRKSFQEVDEFNIEVFEKLCTLQAREKQVEQIEKDIKRSFSAQKKHLRYLSNLLRKLLLASSNSGVQYSQGMNYILLNIAVWCLQSLGIDENNFHLLQIQQERDIFIIFRETVIRLEQVFGKNNIFKVLQDLQNKLSESVPDILYKIYQFGMDCFSVFSQNYYSLMTYNDPPEELCKQMMDLFFLEGQKAIHAMIVKMLEATLPEIQKIKDAESLQKFLKRDIYHSYYKIFKEEKINAKKLSDFGLCFFDNVQSYQMK